MLAALKMMTEIKSMKLTPFLPGWYASSFDG
jgi:hypothetical protein